MAHGSPRSGRLRVLMLLAALLVALLPATPAAADPPPPFPPWPDPRPPEQPPYSGCQSRKQDVTAKRRDGALVVRLELAMSWCWRYGEVTGGNLNATSTPAAPGEGILVACLPVQLTQHKGSDYYEAGASVDCLDRDLPYRAYIVLRGYPMGRSGLINIGGDGPEMVLVRAELQVDMRLKDPKCNGYLTGDAPVDNDAASVWGALRNTPGRIRDPRDRPVDQDTGVRPEPDAYAEVSAVGAGAAGTIQLYTGFYTAVAPPPPPGSGLPRLTPEQYRGLILMHELGHLMGSNRHGTDQGLSDAFDHGIVVNCFA